MLVIIYSISGLFSYLSLGKEGVRAGGVDLFLFRKSIFETDVLMNICRGLALVAFLINAVIGNFSLKENILIALDKT